MEIEKHITRKSNLEADDSLSSFMNHTAQQSHNTYRVFFDFISDTKPKRILEIGTSLGGFTNFLKIVVDYLELDTEIISYDINEIYWYDEMRKSGIDVRVENVFNHDYSSVDETVIDFIQKDGLTIVLCDGGNKKAEFNLLSNYLKEGDIIMAHDYCYDYEKFENDIKLKIWNWCEITESDIMESCERNNLSDFNQKIFDSVVWVCKMKK